jgi:hypothetical protein
LIDLIWQKEWLEIGGGFGGVVLSDESSGK